MSGKGITRKKAMNSTKRTQMPEDGNADRRRFLQGGLTATIASAVGLSGLVGSAAAKANKSKSRSLELMHEDTSPALLDELASPLLERLADEGVLPRASSDVFPSHGLTTSDEPGGVAVYRVVETSTVERTAVRFFDDRKVTINMPVNGQAYAIVTPADVSALKRRYELSVEGVKVTSYGSGGISPMTSHCGDYCGGSTCSSADNCWWEDRYCVEDCLDDGTCHESCQCGCP